MIEAFHLKTTKIHHRDVRFMKKYGIGVLLILFTYLLLIRTTVNWKNEVREVPAKLEIAVPSCAPPLFIPKAQSPENLTTDDFDDERISYENKRFIEYEKQRKGPGEYKSPFVKLTDLEDIKKNEEWKAKEGFSVVVSDKMSLDRSLPDWRPKACTSKKYLKKLPKVSVIIVFHDEILSILLRLMHSVMNRSPPELLHEIVLVNDASTYENLGKELEDHIEGDFFEGKVKYHRNLKREGTIRTRMIGARLTEAEVIVFLDSHMEVGTTWLPPLLEPIVKDPTVTTVPILESLDPNTFEYITIGNGYNGIFDWSFRYQYIKVNEKYRRDLGENYPLATMTAGAYAIRRDHFFYLGGYDEGMKVYNGENWTLSFKLWLCNGSLIHVPCSRVIHLSKTFSAHRTADNAGDYFAYNLKRVVEVWFDEYKKYFYRTSQARYDAIDPGDLTEELAIKKKLKCKPFKYFLDEIAPQILEYYPLEPTYYAMGTIQSIDNQKCLKLNVYNEVPHFENCTTASNFTLTLEKSLRFNDNNDQCFVSDRLVFSNCNHNKGPQLWTYNITTQHIKSPSENKCLAEKDEKILLENCDEKLNSQKWKWTVENSTALENFSKEKN